MMNVAHTLYYNTAKMLAVVKYAHLRELTDDPVPTPEVVLHEAGLKAETGSRLEVFSCQSDQGAPIQGSNPAVDGICNSPDSHLKSYNEINIEEELVFVPLRASYIQAVHI